MSDEQKKDYVKGSVYFRGEDKARLDRMQKLLDRPVSWIVRKALERYEAHVEKNRAQHEAIRAAEDKL